MWALALAASLPWLVADASPRVLVYSYSIVTTQADEADHAYGVNKMDPGGGGTFYVHNINQHYRLPPIGGPQPRTGTVAVEFVREQADGGLVLHVTEGPAAPGAAVDPVTCVVFGDTTVVCDPNRTVAPEIPTLLALLGKNFVDPSRLDAARHWHLEPQGTHGTQADYTIVRNDGMLLDINLSGTRSQDGSPIKTTIEAKLQYDAARSLPTDVDETTVEQSHRGSVAEKISTHTTLKLQSDSNQPEATKSAAPADATAAHPNSQ